MLHKLETKDEILMFLKTLKTNSFLEDFQIGLCGSFAREENKKNSTIDVVLYTKDKESKIIGDRGIENAIQMHFEEKHLNKVNIIWLNLVEDDVYSISTFLKENNLPINENNPYTSIVSEVLWVEEAKEGGSTDEE